MGANGRHAHRHQGPEIGTVLLGKYTVERVIGRGGMAFVVAAYHADLRQRVAIKLLRPESLADDGVVARFMREARASARLESEHVVKIIDVGKLESGAPYMVMEYLEGQDLRALLLERGLLPPVTAVDYLLQAIDAIAEAHAHDIVHRDLKPANLFLALRSDGSHSIKVLDFGVAKIREGGSSAITGTKMMLGSPRYMSPEQFRSAKSVDQRTDVWALGVLLYRLLSGAVPFDGDNMAVTMNAILAATPERIHPRIAGVSLALDAVVFRCLEKEPGLRFGTVAELAEALSPHGSGKYKRCVTRANKLLGRRSGNTVVAQEIDEATDQSEVRAFAETRLAPMPPRPSMPSASSVSSVSAVQVAPRAPMSRRRADRTAAAIGVGAALAIAAFVALAAHLVHRNDPPADPPSSTTPAEHKSEKGRVLE